MSAMPPSSMPPRRRIRSRAIAALVALSVLAACGGSRPTTGVLLRTDAFDTVRDAGMAVAPVLARDPAVRIVDHSALMTDEIFATLFASSGGEPLVAPDELQAIVENGGASNLERYQDFRSSLAAGELPSKEDCVRMSRVVQHRFLFVSWYGETTSTGVETGTGDYTEPGFANEVGRTEFSEVIGQLEAVIVDLWEGEVVWRAVEDYRTERLYGAREAVEAELERTRVGAAARLAAHFDPA